MKNLKNNKSTGPSSIPTKFLKFFQTSLSEPISSIANISFSSGNFPSPLKIANVIPLFTIIIIIFVVIIIIIISTIIIITIALVIVIMIIATIIIINKPFFLFVLLCFVLLSKPSKCSKVYLFI